MTHEAFIKKYLGRFTDYDGKWGNQCVDLIRRYTTDVLGVEAYKAIPAAPTAKAIYTNFRDNAYFKKVANTPNGIPKQGDLIFFKTSLVWRWLYGFAGHTAVVHSADLMTVTVLEQNYPTGGAIRLFKRSYKDCSGWLTRK
jgi:hypothetical protein